MTRNFAALVLLTSTFLPQALARSCYIDRYGNRHCSGLSTGARAGIAVGIILGGAFLVILALAIWIRCRRIQQAKRVVTVDSSQQPYQPGFYQSNQTVSRQPYEGYANQKPVAPQTQYPAAVHAPTGYSNWAPGTYAPPSGQPRPPRPSRGVAGTPPNYATGQPDRNTPFGNQARV